MCGLVGIAGNIIGSHKKMFRDMLVFDQVRGFDSTGFALVYNTAMHCPDKENRVLVDKDTGPAQMLWDYGSPHLDYRGVVENWPKVMIGHNRAATVGNITQDNAHPFQYDHITGAHNGSLTYWRGLDGYGTLDVDSKAIFLTIANKGIDHTWKSFYGAAALTFWDENAETLNLIRNDERPLVIAWSKDQKTLFWASEPWMIQAAAWRNEVDLLKNEKGKVVITSLTPNKLYSYKPTMTGITLGEERVLEKKQATTSRITAGGRTTTRSVSYKDDINFPKSWKKGTKRCKLDRKGLEILYPRTCRKLSKVNDKMEDFFRFTLNRNGIYIGSLDIIATNVAEYRKFEELIDAHRNGDKHLFKLNANPRHDVEEPGMNQRYVATVSALEYQPVKKKVIPLTPPTDKNSDVPEFFNSVGWKVTKAEIESDIAKAGGCCGYCNSAIDDPKEYNDLLWVNKDAIICPSCQNDWGEQIQELVGVFGGGNFYAS